MVESMSNQLLTRKSTNAKVRKNASKKEATINNFLENRNGIGCDAERSPLIMIPPPQRVRILAIRSGTNLAVNVV